MKDWEEKAKKEYDEELNSYLFPYRQWIKDNVVYDLQGRKINNNAKKGLYIINGKKVVK